MIITAYPTTWKNNYRRFKLSQYEKKKKILFRKNYRFRDTVTGDYKTKKVLNVLYLFYSINYEKFLKHKDDYFNKLLSIEKYLKTELKYCIEVEKYDIIDLPKPEDYNSLTDLKSMFWTLSYISDRHCSVIRLVWLLGFIEQIKINEI